MAETLPERQKIHILQWHITHKCNLRCTHCYQEDYSFSMSREDMTAALDKYERFLQARGLRGQINLTGGEPLLHPDFWFLAEEIRRRGLRMAVLTNGTMISATEALRFAQLEPVFVQISLDGTEKVHDAIRGKGTYAKSMEAVDLLRMAGIRVLVSFTAQKKNARCLRGLAKDCRGHDVSKLWWDRVVTESPEEKEKLALTTERFSRLVKQAARLREKIRRRNGEYLISNQRALQFLCGGPGGYTCGAGGNLLILLADGALMPCRRLPFVIGNIWDGELEEIISGSELMCQLANAPLPENCAGCAHADRCRGGARCVTYGQTGELWARDVNCFVKEGK